MSIEELEHISITSSAISLRAELPPLRMDEGGVVRVGNGRVSLDVVVEQFEKGMTPEEMVRAYDTLLLADVYSAIAYYFRHRDEVLEYLKRRIAEAEALRVTVETEHPRLSRHELLTRIAAGETDHAPAGK